MRTLICSATWLRNSIRYTLTGLALLVCAAADCNTVGFVLTGTRPAPVIIPTGLSPSSLKISLAVDLRYYPDASSVAWEFGDGGATNTLPLTTGRSVTHEFPRAGVYNVQVHLFDSGDVVNARGPSKIGSGFLPVEVAGPNTLPFATFQIQNVTDADGNDQPLTRRFNAGASRDPDGSIAKYEWDFGDGETGEGISVEHTFPVGGRYEVRLTVTDNRDGAASTTRVVFVNRPPVADFTFVVASEETLTVSFAAAGSNDPDGTISSFSWNFGDNTPAGSGQAVVHSYGVPGTYNVTLTVTDDFGATASISKDVLVQGIDIFVESISPVLGVENTVVTGAIIRGQNFVSDGIAVVLRRNSNSIQGTNINVLSSQELTCNFNLTAAELGDYDVVVVTRLRPEGFLAGGFRVVTNNRVRLETTLGDIVLELVPDAPVTTANFLQYVEDRFYDGTIFHRVIPNFVVQGGGILPGGTPQSGVRAPIINEFSPSRSNVRSTVAMAKLGNDPDSATSQFFVNLADNSANLDNQNGGFTVFANVIVGMNVVDDIAAVPLNGESPVTDVILTRARRE